MMDFDKYLKANVYIPSDIVNQLEALTNNYPWFSLAHQLVLLGYAQNDDKRFTLKCQHAAIYTLNRKRLHNFLIKASKYKQPVEQAPVETIVDSSPTPVVDEQTNNDNNIAAEILKDDLLLNFGHEYFSIEDLAPIEAAEQEESDDTLISKFISENPRIIPRSSSISDLGNLIQIEDEVDDEPVSETLAEIYASQGLISQAISVYEKLSLLNPEKSIYFASLIEQLRNKHK